MTSTQTGTQKPSFLRVLSNRPFGLLWIGQMVSQSGDYIFDVVALWLVLQLTGDIFKVGLTTATIFLPPVVIGPLAGVYVDKFNRRDIILVSNIFQAATVAGIAVLYTFGSLSFPILLVLLFLLNGKIIGPISSLLSSKELVEKSAALIRPEDQIVIYDINRSSLPFYLNVSRPIWIVWSGRKSSIMGSFYMAEKKPQPAAGYGQVLFTFDEFSMASKESPRRLLIFVEEKGFTRLHKQLNALPKRPLKISEVILVTNE